MPALFCPRVVIADDHPAILHTVMGLLDSREFRVVAAVDDGDLVLDAVQRFQPDLVILDIFMPRLDGLRTAQELKVKGFAGCIIFLTIEQDDDYLAAAMELGARAYVLKSQIQTDLVPAIGEAMSGKTFVSSSVSRN